MDGVGLLKKSSYYKEEGKKDQEKIDKTYIDNVSGYTIKQIEDALTGVETFEDWKNNLKSKYPDNETKENLDAAFTYWISR